MLDAQMTRETGVLLPVTVALFCGIVFAFLMIHPRRKMPSYQRACQLAKLAGLNERGWAALNVLYGRDPLDPPRIWRRPRGSGQPESRALGPALYLPARPKLLIPA